MKNLTKIIITIVAFFILGFAITLLKQSRGSNTGYGGPIGLALVFVFFAFVRGVWRYKANKNDDWDNNRNLNK